MSSLAVFFMTFAMSTNALAAIPVGTKMSYRISRETGTPGHCEFRVQIAHKEILSFDENSGTYLVHLKYVNEKDGSIALEANASLTDETRKSWGLYSREEIQYMVDHCEELGGQLPKGEMSIYACDLRSETANRKTSWLIMPGLPFGTVARSVSAKDHSKDCSSLLIVNQPHLK